MQQAAEKREAEHYAKEAERDAKYNDRFNRILDLIENHEHRIQRQENR